MANIPEKYRTEAARRLREEVGRRDYYILDPSQRVINAIARTLQELGWTPPIDEARTAKARKVAGALFMVPPSLVTEKHAKTAYDALGED